MSDMNSAGKGAGLLADSNLLLSGSNLLSPQPAQRLPSPGMGGMNGVNPMASPFSGIKEPLRRGRSRATPSVTTDLVNVSTADLIRDISEHEKLAAESSSIASTSSVHSSPSFKDGDVKSLEDHVGTVSTVSSVAEPFSHQSSHDRTSLDAVRLHPPPPVREESLSRVSSASSNNFGGDSAVAAPLSHKFSDSSELAHSPHRLSEPVQGISLSPPRSSESKAGDASRDHAAAVNRRYSTNSIGTPIHPGGGASLMSPGLSPFPSDSLAVKIPAGHGHGAVLSSSGSAASTPMSGQGTDESPMKSFVSVKQLTNQLIQAKNEANRLNRKIKELTATNEELTNRINHHESHHQQHLDLHLQEKQHLREQLEAERQLHYQAREGHLEELTQTKEEHDLERRQLRESLLFEMKQEGHSNSDYVGELEEMNLSYAHEIERLKEQLATEQKLHGFTKSNYEEQLAHQQTQVDKANDLAKEAVAAQNRAQTELLTVQSMHTDLALQLELQAAEFKLRTEEAHVGHLQDLKQKLNEERRVHEKAEAQLLFQEKQRSKEQLDAANKLCKSFKADYDALLPRYTAERDELVQRIDELTAKLKVVSSDNESYLQNNEQLNALVRKQKADMERRIQQMEASYVQQREHMKQLHAQELQEFRDECDDNMREAGLAADAHIAEVEANHRQSERGLNVTIHKLQLDLAEKDKARLKLINDYEAKLQRAYDSSSVAVSKAIDETIRVLLRDYGIGDSVEDDSNVDATGNPSSPIPPDAGTPKREAAINQAISRFAEDDRNKAALQRKSDRASGNVHQFDSGIPGLGNATPTQGIMKGNSRDGLSDEKSPSVRFAARPHVITYEAPDSGSSGEDSDHGSRNRLSSAPVAIPTAAANRPVYTRKDTPSPSNYARKNAPTTTEEEDLDVPHVTRKPTGFEHSSSSSSSSADSGSSPVGSPDSIGRLRKLVSREN
jgi:hypothetical protein